MAEFSTNSQMLYFKKIETRQESEEPSWVYYKKLQQTHPTVYNYANRVLSNYDRPIRRKETANKLYSMANIELSKELKLLNTVFEKDMSVEWSNLTQIKQFLAEIQEIIQYKNTAASITKFNISKESYETIATFFSNSFNRTLENFLKTKALINFQNKTLNPTTLENYINQNMEQIIDLSFEDMINSTNLNKYFLDDKTSQNLLETLKLLESISSRSKFLIAFNRIYGIDKRIKQISKNIRGNSGRKKLEEGLREKTKKGSRRKVFVKTTSSRSENLEEALEIICQNELTKINFNNNEFNINFNSKISRESSKSFEFNTTVDLNQTISNFDIALNSLISEPKQEAIETIAQISRKMEKINSNFFIYTNSLKNGFNGFGGELGENISLNEYFNLLSKVQNTQKLSQFVTAIMNTLSGSIGESNKSSLELLLSQDLAYFLFDDFETIAEQNSVNNNNAIHLFSLGTWYVPLSFFLRALAESFENIQNKPTTYAIFSIYGGSIAYPEGPYDWEKWENQREMALNEIEIGIKFLKNLQQIILEFLK